MKKSYKLLFVLLALVISIGCFTAISAQADDEDNVRINKLNFPDATFRQAITDFYDDNGDGVLDPIERNVNFMSVSGMIDTETETIRDLKGIEFFPALVYLRCGGIGLESLDVSQNVNLQSLTCPGNKLEEIELWNNTNLVDLNCSDNELTYLNLPYSGTLTKLHCYANRIEEINIRGLVNLQDFRCDQNELKVIDFTNSIKLERLNCTANHLTSIDLSRCTKLGRATDYMIGEQTVTLEAELQNGLVVIPFPNSGLGNGHDVTTSIDDYNLNTYFDYYQFVTDDIMAIKDGIDYGCFPLLEGSEKMSVHVDIIRDFYQVDFYSDDTFSNRIGYSIVENGGRAIAPTGFEAPECKEFDRWNTSFGYVTDDKIVYALWNDAHSFVITDFDGEYVTLTCMNCNEEAVVKFADCINAATGDNNYYSAIDVVADNYINAKDYAKLCKDYK